MQHHYCISAGKCDKPAHRGLLHPSAGVLSKPKTKDKKGKHVSSFKAPVIIWTSKGWSVSLKTHAHMTAKVSFLSLPEASPRPRLPHGYGCLAAKWATIDLAELQTAWITAGSMFMTNVPHSQSTQFFCSLSFSVLHSSCNKAGLQWSKPCPSEHRKRWGYWIDFTTFTLNCSVNLPMSLQHLGGISRQLWTM